MPETSSAQGRNTRSPAPARSVGSGLLANVSAALLALGWLAFPLPIQSPDLAPSPRVSPHLWIERIDSLTTDPSGRMHRRIVADELRRTSPGAKSTLVRPRLTVLPAAGPMWRFESETGEVSPDGKNIYLPGPVRGRRGAVDPLEIDGRDFRIRAANDYGESDEPATIREASFEARGTGVKIWIGEGRIELLHDASGILRPR